LSRSSVTDLVLYLRSRMTWPVMALWGSMIVLLRIADPTIGKAHLAWHALFLAVAIAVFRLWDDIADIERDRVRHPDRIVVNSAHLRTFILVILAGLGCLALMLLGESRDLISYAALLLILVFVYHTPAGQRLVRPVRAYIILVKYPVLLLIAAAFTTGRTWFVALILYIAVGLYEWYDDRELRSASFPIVLGGGVVGSVLVSAFALIGISGS